MFEVVIVDVGCSLMKWLLVIFVMMGVWFWMLDFNGCVFIKVVVEYLDFKFKLYWVVVVYKMMMLVWLMVLVEVLLVKDLEMFV